MQHWEGPCPDLFAPGQWYGDSNYKYFQHDERAFSPSEERDSKAKVDFIEASIRQEHNFENDNPTDPEIRGIVNWLAGRSAAQVSMPFVLCCFCRGPCARQVNAYRESVITKIEQSAAALKQQGACKHWLDGTDAVIRAAAHEVNGPLMATLAKSIKCDHRLWSALVHLHCWIPFRYHDAACVDMFRLGGDLLGTLCCSGNGVPVQSPAACTEDEIVRDMAARNRELLKGLREDVNSDVSLKKAEIDAKLGRMLWPRPLRDGDIVHSVLSPRMCIEQGVGKDGAPKFRAVDDFTRSHVNACTQPTEKLSCDTLDAVFRTLRELSLMLDCPISMFKADIDAAFRRVPIAAAQRRYAKVVFKHKGKVMVSRHNCMPFGSIASVHNWDRVGSFLCAMNSRCHA